MQALRIPLLIAALLLGACSPSPPVFVGTDLSAVDWGGDFSLQAHTGKRVSTADYRGKVLLLFFGYTHCPDICAPTLVKLATVHKTLGADASRVQVLFVTIDPKHDSAAQLAGFVPKFDPSFVGLTGTPEEIAAVAHEYKVAYVPTPTSMSHQVLIDHSGGVLVKDGRGKLRLLFKNEMSAADMEHDLRLLLKQDS